MILAISGITCGHAQNRTVSGKVTSAEDGASIPGVNISVSPNGNKAIIEKNVGGRWEWELLGETKFAVNDNKLELEIKRDLLNLSGNEIDIEFKWNDNMQENGNIMDFYVNGDTAPGGRFNFVYSTR